MVSLVAVVVIVINRAGEPTDKPPATAPQTGVDALLAQVNQLIQESHAGKDRTHLARAERMLRAALKQQTADEDRLWAALGHVHVARATFEDNATAAEQHQVPDSARRMFQRALQINPNNARALRAMAKHHEFRKDYQAALALDEKVLASAPHDLEALKHKGRCLLMLGQYARAEQATLAALAQAEAVGDRAAVIFAQELLGTAYLKQRKYRLAEKVLLQAVAGAEASKVAACPYAALGELYSATGREAAAVKTSMRAADMEASVPQMQYLAALTCYEQGYYPDAQKYIQRALKLARGQVSYRKLRDKILAVIKPGPADQELAAALNHLQEYEYRRAGIHVDRALAAGADSKARVVKGYLQLLQKKYTGAEELFRAAEKATPSDAGARVGLGHLGIVRKRYAAARRQLEPAVRQGHKQFGKPPVSEEALGGYPWMTYRMACLGMGWLLANQNQHPAALAHFDRILASDSDDIFALLGKGNSLNALRRLDGAQKHLQRVLDLDPYNQYALAELALVKLNRGKLGEAERLIKAALRQSGSVRYTCPHEGLGMVYMRAGKLGLARASFRKAIDINPNIEFKKYNGLARIMIREGKYARARTLLRKSIQNYPHDDEARKLLATIRRR